MHSAEKAHDTTLDDENALQHVTSVVVAGPKLSLRTSVTTNHVTCLFFQLCQLCCRDDNEAQLLLCDMCDRGYHTYCIKVSHQLLVSS